MDHDPIADALELLAQGEDIEREHEAWREERRQREVRGEVLDEVPLTRMPEPAPSPELALSDGERRKFDRWYRGGMKEPSRRKQAFTRVQVAAIGGALAAERRAMREHVAGELATLKAEITTLKAELAVREEHDAVRQRAHIIDLPAVAPRRESAA